MRKGTWPKIEPVEQAKRLIAPLVAFVGGDEDEQPTRQSVFTIRDAEGNTRQVYAPPGTITRWP
jgi:hypothetical protein